MNIVQTDIDHYRKQGRKVQCILCPHQCFIHEGKYGICGVRRNLGGRIRSRNYGLISSQSLDPIEKKPLYHFHPGSMIYSIGSLGCNLKCNFCQNWQISQVCYTDDMPGHEVGIEEIVDKMMLYPNNIGMAFTYNEPTVWFEFMYRIAEVVKQKNKSTVMVTNGFINPAPLQQLFGVIDAFNVDLKGFSEIFYRDMAGGTLKPVLDSLLAIKKADKHLEITNLVIPGKNDHPDTFLEMVRWIAGELGSDTVLHLSGYFPRYKQNAPQTPISTLTNLHEIASQYLQFVYIGNSPTIAQHTNCPYCGALLISRTGYSVSYSDNYKNGHCLLCNNEVITYF